MVTCGQKLATNLVHLLLLLLLAWSVCSAWYVFVCMCDVQTSKLRLFDREQPLYSEARVLPPSKLASSVLLTGG
jgi:hypothetical protein